MRLKPLPGEPARLANHEFGGFFLAASQHLKFLPLIPLGRGHIRDIIVPTAASRPDPRPIRGRRTTPETQPARSGLEGLHHSIFIASRSRLFTSVTGMGPPCCTAARNHRIRDWLAYRPLSRLSKRLNSYTIRGIVPVFPGGTWH